MRARLYQFVVLSDHGQSQGLPFEKRYGRSLGDVCSELTREDVVSLEENVESWGRVESVLDDLAGADSIGEQIDERWPRLLPGLAATPGVGFSACSAGSTAPS